MNTFEQLTTHQFNEELTALTNELHDLLLHKREKYGSRNLTRHGLYGIVVRAHDKVERLTNQYDPTNPFIEDDEDAWLDLAGYALLGLLASRLDGRRLLTETAEP